MEATGSIQLCHHNGADGLEVAKAIAKGAGFDVNKADLLKAQASQILVMSDEKTEHLALEFLPRSSSMICWHHNWITWVIPKRNS
jgi:hypothetical protein